MRDLIPLTVAHAEVAAAIHRQCFAQPWDRAAMAGMLAMPGCFGWIAGKDYPLGLILCRVAADEAELLTIGILPGQRSRGYAGRLLAAAQDEARTAGAQMMFLEVATDNVAAQRLYQKHGFAMVGRRHNYYGQGTHALVLQRALTG